MSTALTTVATAGFAAPVLPDHMQLPDSDGSIVHNFHEHPQTILLTECILPVLRKLHPDGQFAIGADSGIYFRPTDPPLEGCRAPDWFYVPHVPPMATRGLYRRSYVMWQEIVPPLLVFEIVSGDGQEEHDRTPLIGKFWIYERAIRAGYYAIHDPLRETLEVFRLHGGGYQAMIANERGRFTIPELEVDLGTWVGQFNNVSGVFARFFTLEGALLPAGEERADKLSIELEHEQSARRAAETEAARLRDLLAKAGIPVDPR